MLLGWYSQWQGIYSKSGVHLSIFAAEAWGFLLLQFSDLFEESHAGTLTCVHVHHVCESGLEVKAAQVSHNCSIMRFETLWSLVSP